MTPSLDLKGQRFGNLVAQSMSVRDERQVFWICECDCGKRKAIPVRLLRSGVKTSCGCKDLAAVLCATCNGPIDRRRRGNGAYCSRGCIRGRSNPGESHPNARFTEDQVREIRRRRANGETVKDLAAEFGVTKPAITYVVNTGWKHVV